MQKQKGFSLIGVLLIIGVLLLTAGGVVVWERKVSPTVTPPSISIIPSPTPTEPTTQSWKPKYGGECPPWLLKEKIDIKKLYEQTNAPSCGKLNTYEDRGEDYKIKLAQMKGCISNAVSACKQTKSYVYLQGSEGSVDYFILTKDCKIIAKHWGNTTPYCGVHEESCQKLSQYFPEKICPYLQE